MDIRHEHGVYTLANESFLVPVATGAVAMAYE